MLGPFATASRLTPHYHSPGVATGGVALCLRIDVHDDDDDNDNVWQRGPLWPHGMGPISPVTLELRGGESGILAATAAIWRSSFIQHAGVLKRIGISQFRF